MKNIYFVIALALTYSSGWATNFKSNSNAIATHGSGSQTSKAVVMPPSYHSSASRSASPFAPKSVSYFGARAQFTNFKIIASDNGLPLMVSATLKNPVQDINTQVFQYLNGLKELMQITQPEKEFVIGQAFDDGNGESHIRMKQVYQGLPVFNAEIMLHIKNGVIVMMNGRYLRTPKGLPVTGGIPEAEAKGIVAKEMGGYHPYIPSTQMTALGMKTQNATAKEIYHNNFQGTATLCWHITYQPTMIHTWEIYIDATTGTVLNKFDRACSFLPPMPSPMPPATGSGTDLNNVSRTVNCYNSAGTYYMLDASRPMFDAAASQIPDNPKGAIWVLDWNNEPQNSTGNVFYISSSNTTFSDAKSVSAYYNAATSYEYYRNTFNRNAIDNKGGTILSLINVADENGAGMDNAFWDGQYMYYGNGNQAFTSPLMKDLDVGGHEMSHGVIQSTADLTYQGQSGAMNESFADIFGCMIERQNWTLGEHITNPAYFPSHALRDMSDPHNGAQQGGNGWQPANMSEFVQTSQDNGGVHINSGICNRAFYLFTVDAAVGKATAEQVYYRALSKYLFKSSQFSDLRLAVLKAAEELYPGNTAIQSAACNAFDAVGITGGCSANATVDNHQENLQENPGNDYIVYLAADDNNVLHIADGNGNNIGYLDTFPAISKPSVSDDGTLIVYVGIDKHIHLVQLDYATGTPTSTILSADTIWRNAAISKDGNRISALTTNADSMIYVYDFTTNPSTAQAFALYNPTSGSVKGGGVRYADAMEWDYTSQWVMYDALSIINVAGHPIQQWDVGFLHAWNGNGYADGTVQKLFSSLPDTISVGNPVFSKNSPYIIAFDYISEGIDTLYGTDGANLQSGDVGGIIGNNQPGFASYSRTDSKVIFNTNITNHIEIDAIGMNADKINYSGAVTRLIDYGYNGVWIAAGTRSLPSGIGTLKAKDVAIKVYPNPFSGILTLAPKQESENATITVTDLQGREVFIQTNKPVKAGSTIDLGFLNSGIYFLQYRTNDSRETVKIVKMQ